MDAKKLKIEFAPGVLEQLEKDMSPEELQEFMNMIKAKIDDGSFLDESEPVDLDVLEEEDPEAYEKIMAAGNYNEPPKTLH
jgi:hypothetical protein